jgi:hypothetical protein
MGLALLLGATCLMIFSPSAFADEWLPHPANAQWQYDWTDSTYDPSGTIENVVVSQQAGAGFTLSWADQADQPPPAGSTRLSCPAGADLGWMTFDDWSNGLGNQGLANTNWSSCPPPPSMPVLCASSVNCANSLQGTLYDLIWGNRVPLLAEPLLQDTSWNSAGGAQDEVASTSQFQGDHLIKVPAFPQGVLAAKVVTNLALAGTAGDDYGSGIRTTWWVAGVGPVLVVFDHVDGSVSRAALLATNLKPVAVPPDQDYFPLLQGLTGRYEMTNTKHLRQPEIEKVRIAAVSNRTARVDVTSVSGPMRAAGSYIFSLRFDGLRNTSGITQAASLAKFPAIGHGRHFFNPLDLMTFGFNPVLSALPEAGQSWRSGNPRDMQIYGVKGRTWVVGIRTVRVPAGTFRALEVESKLTQAGYPFGSGTRTMWFAPGRGLVKLVFRHRDASTTVVQLLR